MKSGVFIWTVANDYGARIPDDDTLGAMNPALFKVNDGVNQMQTVAQAVALAKQYRDQNIDFLPWGVGRGFDLSEARAEGRLAGEYAAATSSPYILDLEPDPSLYWQGIPGTPTALIAGFNETAKGQRIRLCCDARLTAAGPTGARIDLNEWVTALPDAIWHPMGYYTDFASHDAATGIMSAINPLLNAGVHKSQIYPVLPLYYASAGNPSITPVELSSVLDWVAQQGYPGAAYWRRGLMSPEQVAMLLAKVDPWAPIPQPQPQPGPSPKKLALAHIEAARIAVEGLP